MAPSVGVASCPMIRPGQRNSSNMSGWEATTISRKGHFRRSGYFELKEATSRRTPKGL